jgi:hypothetical protein
MNDLSYQKKNWQKFASSSDFNLIAKDLNASWDKESQSYSNATEIPQEYIEIITKNQKIKKILDFGVGFGRNQKYLNSISEEVHGFDLSEMIEKYRQIQKDKNLLFDNIININNDYSLVYECTVFQHMPPQDVIFSMIKLSFASKFLFSYTRAYNDFYRNFEDQKGGINMIHLFASCREFWEVIHYSDAYASEKNDESHFYTLLKSKINK